MKIGKGLSITESLAERATKKAKALGHRNFSHYVESLIFRDLAKPREEQSMAVNFATAKPQKKAHSDDKR